MATQQVDTQARTTDPSRSSDVAQYLTPVVHDLIALSVNGKQAHWHVRGENFIGVHEYLDVVIDNAREASDTVAERIVALGLPVDGRLGTVAAKASTPELADGFQKSEVTVREIVEQIDAVRKTVLAAVEGLDDIDLVSQDIVIAIAQTLDKDRWFLSSHYAE